MKNGNHSISMLWIKNTFPEFLFNYLAFPQMPLHELPIKGCDDLDITDFNRPLIMQDFTEYLDEMRGTFRYCVRKLLVKMFVT